MRTAPFRPAVQPDAPPLALQGLEEVAAARPGDWPQAAAFALWRACGGTGAGRPLAFVATAQWRRERGGLSARGLAGLGIDLSKVLMIRADREPQALWALEEALKSGAVSGGVATVEAPSLVATRRLDFAARDGRATGVLLRAGAAGDLSAARLRWRISAQPSAAHGFDAKASGAARLEAALARRRDGPLGVWDLEQDDGTHRLRLAARLAGDGLVQGRRTAA